MTSHGERGCGRARLRARSQAAGVICRRPHLPQTLSLAIRRDPLLPPVIEGPRGGGVRAHRLAGSAAVGAGPLDTVQVA